jgi:hypothetical protein
MVFQTPVKQLTDRVSLGKHGFHGLLGFFYRCHLRCARYLLRVIRASPDISADARYYVSLILIAAKSLRPTLQ